MNGREHHHRVSDRDSYHRRYRCANAHGDLHANVHGHSRRHRVSDCDCESRHRHASDRESSWRYFEWMNERSATKEVTVS